MPPVHTWFTSNGHGTAAWKPEAPLSPAACALALQKCPSNFPIADFNILWEACKTFTGAPGWCVPSDTIRWHPGLTRTRTHKHSCCCCCCCTAYLGIFFAPAPIPHETHHSIYGQGMLSNPITAFLFRLGGLDHGGWMGHGQ